jgi:glucose/arabinose dehydrogenase
MEKFFGSILQEIIVRIIIPPDNPFVGRVPAKFLPELYSSGFRNPNRINWTASGKMLATNIGHGNIEALYEISPGSDQGWPYREGHFEIRTSGNMNNVFELTANDTSLHYNYPIAAYDHDEGKAIAGGYAYSGTRINALQGRYIFGDIVSGRLFYIDMKDATNTHPAEVHEWRVSYRGHIKSLHDLCGNDRVDLRFGHDKKGEIYVLTKADGMIYRLLP